MDATLRKMSDRIKHYVKQFLPHGFCEYSIRRHDFLRQGFSSREATRIALSARRHAAFLDSRLDLLPKTITAQLKTCVDAGAHVGNWSACLLDLFTPEHVILLECEPKLVTQLQNRFRGEPRVRVVNSALSAGRGRTTFHRLQHPASSSILEPRSEIGREYQRKSWDVIDEIKVTTIGYDEMVEGEEEISILKLDIQGAEKSVLLSSTQGLRKTKSIIIEVLFTSHYHGEGGFFELHQLLVEKGFGLYRLSSPYHRGGRALFADASYVKESLLRDELSSPEY